MYQVIAVVDGSEVVFFKVDSLMSAEHNLAYLVSDGWQGCSIRQVPE